MKQFLKSILLFSFLSVIIFGSFVFLADGETDPFYLRFTSPKQTNMILGTSRSAQGLMPTVFAQELGVEIFNYSFTLQHSPYGPVYLESIKRKLAVSDKDQLFILAVDPWSVSNTLNHQHSGNFFPEKNSILGRMEHVNMNPNPFYLFDHLGDNFPKLFLGSSTMQLHEDGWLEVSISMDSVEVAKRTAGKLAGYQQKIPNTVFSEERLNSLVELVKFLKIHGKVYLVRLPVHPQMKDIENEFMPDFDESILEAVRQSDGYLNLIDRGDDLRFTDGNHLYKESSEKVSKIVADWIRTDLTY